MSNGEGGAASWWASIFSRLFEIELAKDARITELAVEAAYSAGVRNSIERMLVHQMALAHKHAFMMGRKLQAALANAHSDDSANLRATRLATAMARVMGAYQQGTTTLQRLRSGGQQTVVVQHVQVYDGGQAIVAGKVKAGVSASEPAGVEAENDRCTSGTRLAT